jgi:hypothetical protein
MIVYHHDIKLFDRAGSHALGVSNPLHIHTKSMLCIPVRLQMHASLPDRPSLIDLLPVRNNNQLLVHLTQRKHTPLFSRLRILTLIPSS